MERARHRWLRLAALALLLQAAFAAEIDPYHLHRVGGTTNLPPHETIVAVAWAGVGLALLALLLPRPWSASLALVAGAATLLVSTPSNAARFHLFQVLCLALATSAVVAACARGPRMIARLGLVALVLLAVEGVFSMVERSHAVGYTLAARLWFARHWSTPNNSLGYRDVEHPDDGRKKLFVLGDSFVAGVGIADASERFSDRLQALLGERYQVHNIGYNGSDTRYELELLEAYPARPDVLVLSYYINDITGAAAAFGHRPPPYRPYGNLRRPFAWFVSRSYLLDFAYWLLPQPDLAGESRFLAQCFTWPEVVAEHEKDLQRVVDWTRAHDCALIAVVFPALTELEASSAWVAPALEVFAANGIPVIDVRALVNGMDADERVVNANDSHPSVRVHAAVAEALRARVEGLSR